MRDIAPMRHRIDDLHSHAVEFRKLADNFAEPLRAQFIELAQRCDAIAQNIERNLPIHECQS
jgi:hypothetical protein